MRSKPLAIAAATLLLAGLGVSSGVASADPPAPHTPGPAPGPGQTAPGPKQTAPAPQASGQPKTIIDRDGTYAVGTDIVPGIYTSAGPTEKTTCYWKRVGGVEGKEILDNAMTKKPQVVEIQPTDKSFKTDGCQPWQKNDSATVDPGKSPVEAKLQLGILNGIVEQHRNEQSPTP
ncbi:hypothetical protein A5707_13530 [Mycobacterium kyorinense]|uniref:Lipoprotein n=1 Tax=Mycobacterium kyorinense TaxID=487514 RepID=A0A1A2ZPW9_9MYCO|nr:hypothetical protein [Mycobacterium kyorinense]OBI51738.1 hypothetical protein A5707_13530 [Mycobacterium kyorinense]